ncbi:DUF2997 domain-containing protein [Pseudoalteromonas aurantia]|uniref:DUF2997 domain-containing protein n=1 Tax=Pseudoalteromonas aurantia TaxID=43654 RepID=A0ABY2VUH4_9GAMM|nr:DUF2997 domain-containing protein [Pseudoalteromonas aurantia]TMO56524.1 hypothetical protein CWC18_19445 [Pseudoalteromonas aurantia]TMO71922.1 hypothetical protein CWC20_16340 [Pseudoalteromonas aurantia]
MPEQRIVLTIDEEGGVTAKTDGLYGEKCIEAVAELLDEQVNIKSLKKTDDFNKTQSLQIQNKLSLKQGES